MKRIGLIGGMSWESTAIYYRRINETVRGRLGGLHSADVVMRSLDFHDVVELQKAGAWDEAARLLADAARGLEAAGADMVLICTNTMHRLAAEVAAAVDVPLLHICDVTGAAVRAGGHRRPLLLATRYTMEEGFWHERLAARTGIRALVPAEAEDRAAVHDIIFGELCQGIVRPASRERYRRIVAGGMAAGADCVILGCTEIGMLVGPQDLPLPVFDSTLLHADAAVNLALDGAWDRAISTMDWSQPAMPFAKAI